MTRFQLSQTLSALMSLALVVAIWLPTITVPPAPDARTIEALS